MIEKTNMDASTQPTTPTGTSPFFNVVPRDDEVAPAPEHIIPEPESGSELGTESEHDSDSDSDISIVEYPPSPIPFSCEGPGCPSQFPTAYSLPLHIYQHHQTNRRLFYKLAPALRVSCTHCFEVFTTASALHSHPHIEDNLPLLNLLNLLIFHDRTIRKGRPQIRLGERELHGPKPTAPRAARPSASTTQT